MSLAALLGLRRAAIGQGVRLGLAAGGARLAALRAGFGQRFGRRLGLLLGFGRRLLHLGRFLRRAVDARLGIRLQRAALLRQFTAVDLAGGTARGVRARRRVAGGLFVLVAFAGFADARLHAFEHATAVFRMPVLGR